jgi:UDP-galactopyranose mutase
MTRRADFVIVGTGITGATIARLLNDAGCSVLMVERRDHVAGNIFDYDHECGARMNRYGPHYFRTSSPAIWDFVQRFAHFRAYEARVLARVDNRLEQWPVSGSFIRRVAPGFHPGPDLTGTTFEQAACSLVPRQVFELFIREYTEKQWGTGAEALSADLAKRIRVNWNDDARLTPNATYQGLPAHGYTALVANMIHGIPVEMGVDFLAHRTAFQPRRATVFTGGIDEYFGYCLGRLKYRGQRREVVYHSDIDRLQPVAQVNEPQHASGPQIRLIEWKHMMRAGAAERVAGTVVTRETPCAPDDSDHQEYPFPDAESQRLYRKYQELAAREGNVVFCGRLGEYRYLDMDQAIARATLWAGRLTNGLQAAR